MCRNGPWPASEESAAQRVSFGSNANGAKKADVIQYRTFRNSDPPLILTLWNAMHLQIVAHLQVIFDPAKAKVSLLQLIRGFLRHLTESDEGF